MDKKKDLTVFRNRSVRACIGDGYQLYVANFYRIFRSSWLTAVGYALAFSLLTSYFIAEYPKLLIFNLMGPAAIAQQYQWMLAMMGVMALAALLFVVMAGVFFSQGVSALGEHQARGSISAARKWYGRLDRHALGRTFMALGWSLLVYLVVAMLMAGFSMLAMRLMSRFVGMAFVGVMALVVIVLTLPLSFVFVKYLLTPKSSFVRLLGSSYGVGLRHLGAIFMVSLVVGIVTALLSCIIELPSNILYVANVQSQVGVLQGDPAGMPAYMSWMNLLVFAIAGFIQAYVHLSAIFPYYYIYGKIEADETERKQQTKIMK